MEPKIVILGAGFGGLEAATRLSQQLPSAEITLIDRKDYFIIGFSKFDVMFGRRSAEQVKAYYKDLAAEGVRFVQDTITRIDIENRQVETAAAMFSYDFLIVCLGAEVVPEATPGFVEGGHEFYTLDGARRLYPVLDRFEAGTILVSILGKPYKCPPAPYEAAFQLHDFFTRKGVRDAVTIKMLTFAPVPLPVSKTASAEIERRLAERDIELLTRHQVVRLDPDKQIAALADKQPMRYDLFLGVPLHQPPKVVRDSALGGWIPVNTANLETRFENVYAVGDVTTIPAGAFAVAKAGAFAEAGAQVVVNDIVNKVKQENHPLRFDGTGTCYLEFGADEVARINANFLGGPEPNVALEGPSTAFRPDKERFEQERMARWFK